MRSEDYTVRLQHVFQGPLDLLLHLVREQEVEIHEIDIARIVQGYLAYLEQLEDLDIEYAADFLVMAATLMSIKSRSLLPHEELDLEEELDPKDELIQRLIEYRRFKESAADLERRWYDQSRRFSRGFHEELDEEAEVTFELGELTAWDVLAVYSRLMRETAGGEGQQIVADPRPLRFYVERMVENIRRRPQIRLCELLETLREVPPREALIGSFCALLEMVKMDLIDVVQENHTDEITVSLRADHALDIEQVVERSMFDEQGLTEEAPARTEDADLDPEHAPENGGVGGGGAGLLASETQNPPAQG